MREFHKWMPFLRKGRERQWRCTQPSISQKKAPSQPKLTEGFEYFHNSEFIELDSPVLQGDRLLW